MDEDKAPWWQSPWCRRMAVVTTGGLVLALCPFLPWAPARAVCVALGQGIAGVATAPELELGPADAGR